MKQKKYGRVIFQSMVMFFLSFLLCAVSAQAAGNDGGDEAGTAVALYNNRNGLPTSEANAVVQSGDGFIWIGGYSGLIRYDGNEFYRFDATTGITSVVSLYVDSKDRLWIGTNDRGIVLYEHGDFSFFGKEQGLQSVSVRSITEDQSGNIVFATTEGVSYIDAQNELHTLEDARLLGNYTCELRQDAQGRIYGETLSGDAFIIENLEVKVFCEGEDMDFGVVACICPDPNREGWAYLGTEGSWVIAGDLSDEMRSYEKINVAPLANVNMIYSVSEDELWICADNGVGYIDRNGRFHEQSGLPMNNSVDEMIVDYEGNLWFVSSRQGVMKISENRFHNISAEAGLADAVVNTTCMFQDALYIGTDTGLYVLDKDKRQVENIMTRLLAGIRIRSIKKDSEGNLWLCTYSENGLICYDGKEGYRCYTETDGLNSNRVRTVEEMSDGTIVVATSGGVNLIRDGEIVASFSEAEGVRNTETLSVCEGDDGRIYLGSDGGGIYVIDGEQVYGIGEKDGLASEVILRIKKDPMRAGYWIITSNSIAYMEHEEVHTITNFPYSNNFDIFFNETGEIWILSSNGIYVVDGDALAANENDMSYSFYNVDSGLPCTPTANARSYIAKDGTLYISGSSCVSSININRQSEHAESVKLTIPYIEIDDTMMYLEDGDSITVPNDCKRLTIYGYALTYALRNPHVSYYLEGFDEEPVLISKLDMEPVSYTNLRGGTYVFHLSVVNELTGETENEITVTLIKEKAIYERIWFWAVIILAIVLLSLAVVGFYISKKTVHLVEKQKEQKLFINQIIRAFAKSIDIKDHYTNGHSFRVADCARKIAQRLGYDDTKVENVYNIALLHDIGKIAVPDTILNKPGKLTSEEYAMIKQHAKYGYDILKEIESFPELALGAGYHHERIDGAGYPFGKSGEEIPYVARIIAVADTFDAMNSTRPYRKKMPKEEIVAELKRVSGTQLEPEIVDVLLQLMDENAFEE